MPIILNNDEDVKRWLNTQEYSFEDCVDLLRPFSVCFHTRQQAGLCPLRCCRVVMERRDNCNGTPFRRR